MKSLAFGVVVWLSGYDLVSGIFENFDVRLIAWLSSYYYKLLGIF